MDLPSTIKTDAQRDRTLVQIAGFRHALKGVDRGARKRSVAIRRNYEEVIRQLEQEVREYDQLKFGMVTIPKLRRLDHRFVHHKDSDCKRGVTNGIGTATPREQERD